jgi:hypothetical protein
VLGEFTTIRIARLCGALLCGALVATAACRGGERRASDHDTGEDSTYVPPPYAGTTHGIPRYARRAFTPEERDLLLRVYGIEDPNRLYVSDSTDMGLLMYDTKAKTCALCFVNSYLVGFTSVRRPGESWEAVERRVRAMKRNDFPERARTTTTSTASLDPRIRAAVERMLADAERAGFKLRVIDTYRTPEREAYLMAQGKGRTFTLTSMHSYGRAIDIMVGDGRIARKATRQQWIAFRRWVTTYDHGEFQILGTPDDTWDWMHVDAPSPDVGFHTIEEALARARACTASPPKVPCDFAPHLPQSGSP